MDINKEGRGKNSTPLNCYYMAKFTIKDLKEALKNLDENKEIMVVPSYEGNDKIEVEYIKELKENGREYYKVNI